MINFSPIDYNYIVRWQSDLENTKERPLYKPSQDQSKSTALGGVWNFAEQCIIVLTWLRNTNQATSVSEKKLYYISVWGLENHQIWIVSANFFSSLLQSATMEIASGNPDSLLRFGNKRAERALGRSPEEKVKGQSGAIYKGPLMLFTKYW